MLISRVAKLGACLAKHLSTRNYAAMSRIPYIQRTTNHHMQPPGELRRNCKVVCGHELKSGNQPPRLRLARIRLHTSGLPRLSSLSFTKLYNGPMIEKHNLFSTITANNTSEEGSEQKEAISVTFVDKDGEENHIKVPIGMSMLEAAHENDIELEGACEGSLACSTCHVIVMDVEYYNKLEDATDEENDMLDLAFGLSETSRLGCQVIAQPELDGIRLAIPAATRNFAVDGYVPKPH